MDNLLFALISLAMRWLEPRHNAQRPHQGKEIGDNVLDANFRPQAVGEVRCMRQLGGIITHYLPGSCLAFPATKQVAHAGTSSGTGLPHPVVDALAVSPRLQWSPLLRSHNAP